MREILFRAKRKNWRKLTKEEWWVEGVSIEIKDKMYMAVEYVDSERITDFEMAQYILQKSFAEIDPETLCQFTGLTGKNGKQIWENDIVKHEISDTIGTVKWCEEDYVGWCVDDVMIDEQQFTGEMWSECVVIGNAFDDKHFLVETDYCAE